MLLDHTAFLPSDQKKIDALIGPSFSLLDKIKMLGVGSEKMQLLAYSTYFKEVINKHQQTNYGSIELRTAGVIVHFNNGKSYYVWCIPFYRLSVYRTETLNIHGEGEVVKFKIDKNQNKTFLRNLLRQLAIYQERFDSPFS